MTSSLAFRCPACHGNSYRPVTKLSDVVYCAVDGDFQLVRCETCGLLRLFPEPDDATLSDAYRVGYVPYRRSGLSALAKRLAERWLVRDLWDYFRPPRRVVDVGCADGGLLAAIRRADNQDLLGIEPDAAAAERARGLGLEVRVGTLEALRLPSESVSTVVMSHVLEHVPDPAATLGEVRRVLIGGGALVLALPNVESWAARVLRRCWIGYDAPRHLTTFGVTTLTELLEQRGFRVVRVDHEWTGMEWAWGARLMLRDRWPAAEGIVRRLHLPLILLATPIGYLAARRRQSGRVVVVAVKASLITE